MLNIAVTLIIRLKLVIFISFLFHKADPEGMAGKFNNDNITDKVSNTKNFVMYTGWKTECTCTKVRVEWFNKVLLPDSSLYE